jgi:hypothetical protein
MTSYHRRPWKGKHYQTGPSTPGSEAQFQSPHPTGNYGQQFAVPHLLTILERY